DFQIKLLGALSVGDVRTGTIPSLLPSQKHYLKVYMKVRGCDKLSFHPRASPLSIFSTNFHLVSRRFRQMLWFVWFVGFIKE
ncbi:MAG: hypothetical protein V1736_09010, partial [Pseudomonadota bacterium]